MTTASVLIIGLIFVFGLCGASYEQCQNTLESNGYYLTDAQYQEFYETANDPDTVMYINTHRDYLNELFMDAADGYENAVKNGFIECVKTGLDISVTDNNILWGDLVSSMYVSADQSSLYDRSVYGTNGKRISDGHGGYFLLTIEHYSGGVTGRVYHVTADGKYYCDMVCDTADWRNPVFDIDVKKNLDGSVVCSFTNNGGVISSRKYTFSDDATSDVGEILSNEPIDLPVAPDGSITLPDGTKIYPNADGSYTIGGTDYKPIGDITQIPFQDLLKYILDLQDKVKDQDDPWENEDTQDPADEKTDEEIAEEIDEAAAVYNGDLMEFVLDNRLTQVFPFCLPFDLVRGIKLLSVPPSEPVIDVPFKIPSVCGFGGYETRFRVDFTQFKTLLTLCRWIFTISFTFGLIKITFKVVKGAGT